MSLFIQTSVSGCCGGHRKHPQTASLVMASEQIHSTERPQVSKKTTVEVVCALETFSKGPVRINLSHDFLTYYEAQLYTPKKGKLTVLLQRLVYIPWKMLENDVPFEMIPFTLTCEFSWGYKGANHREIGQFLSLQGGWVGELSGAMLRKWW